MPAAVEPTPVEARVAATPAAAEPTPVEARAAATPAAAEPATVEARAAAAPAKDYFVERDGLKFAGTHLLVDMWNAKHLTDVALAEQALREAAAAAGATLLHIHVHHFGPNHGVSGVAVIAESHISIHTWPELAYAALDIFMCGGCDPYKSVPVLRRAFEPASVQICEQKRGVIA
ncbi:MAG: adenosylmethionine decarboxylase [Pseudomonadota bacterium]